MPKGCVVLDFLALTGVSSRRVAAGGASIPVECVELIRLGMDCLDVNRTVVQLEFRSISVGCGGVELHKSDTLPKHREKCESVTSGMCRLSRLFLLGLVVVYQVELV